MTSWANPLHVERLKAMWSEGYSGQQIATDLNGSFGDASYTRSAVIGKVHRLDLPLHSRQAQHAAAKINGKAGKPRGDRHVNPPPANHPLRQGGAQGVFGPAEIIAHGLRVDTIAHAPRHWITRESHECHWPVSGHGYDTMSCCNKTSGDLSRPYCAGHLEIRRQREQTAKQAAAAAERQHRMLHAPPVPRRFAA